MLVSLIAAAWAVRVRFRRATGMERLQLKCLVYSASLVPLSLALGTVFDDDALHALTIIAMFTTI